MISVQVADANMLKLHAKLISRFWARCCKKVAMSLESELTQSLCGAEGER